MSRALKNGDKMIQNKMSRKLLLAVGFLLLYSTLLVFPAKAQETMIGTAQGNIYAPGAGSIPNITVGGEAAYSMFANASLPDNTAFQPAQADEDAGIEAILNAGYPFDSLGLQKKYGVSDDFARVVTQQAIWFYIEGWPIDSMEDSVRMRYINDLLQAAQAQLPQEHPVSVVPESPAFQHQGGFYRSETLTLKQAEGTITVQPDNGVKVLLEDGTAATTLRQGDRFILLAPDDLTEISLNVTHRFSNIVPVSYRPETEDYQTDHLLQAQEHVQTRSGVWRFALPETLSSSTQALSEESAPMSSETELSPSSTSAGTMPQTGSPSTGGTGMPITAAALLGLCWVAIGLACLGKQTRNGRQ